MPAGSEPPVRAAAHLAPARRADGRRASSAALLLVVVRLRLVRLRRRDPRQVHGLPAGHGGRSRAAASPRGYALARSRVVADERRLTVVNGYRRRELRVGRDGRGAPAARRPLGHAGPRRRHDHPGAWASRAPTAPAPTGRSASCAPSSTAPAEGTAEWAQMCAPPPPSGRRCAPRASRHGERADVPRPSGVEPGAGCS